MAKQSTETREFDAKDATGQMRRIRHTETRTVSERLDGSSIDHTSNEYHLVETGQKLIAEGRDILKTPDNRIVFEIRGINR